MKKYNSLWGLASAAGGGMREVKFDGVFRSDYRLEEDARATAASVRWEN